MISGFTRWSSTAVAKYRSVPLNAGVQRVVRAVKSPNAPGMRRVTGAVTYDMGYFNNYSAISGNKPVSLLPTSTTARITPGRREPSRHWAGRHSSTAERRSTLENANARTYSRT